MRAWHQPRPHSLTNRQTSKSVQLCGTGDTAPGVADAASGWISGHRSKAPAYAGYRVEWRGRRLDERAVDLPWREAGDPHGSSGTTSGSRRWTSPRSSPTRASSARRQVVSRRQSSFASGHE